MQSCGINMLLKQLIVNVRRRGIMRMVKSRELRLKCKEQEKNVTWNENNVCEEFDEVTRCDIGVINNDNEEANSRCEIKCDKVINENERKKNKTCNKS